MHSSRTFKSMPTESDHHFLLSPIVSLKARLYLLNRTVEKSELDEKIAKELKGHITALDEKITETEKRLRQALVRLS